MSKSYQATAPRITRADLENKMNSIVDELEGPTSGVFDVAKVAAIVGIVVLVGVAYFFGRGKGKAGNAVLELRRF